MTRLDFEAIGTVWSIHFRGDKHSDVDHKIRTRIEQFDKTYSRFRSDSLISMIARESGTYSLPSDAEQMIDFYRKLYEVSNGLVTPLIGQTLSDAGYDATYSFRAKPLSSPPLWEEVMDFQTPKLIVKRPVLIDFGAAGKGYLVDIIANLFRDNASSSFSINAGGDIYNYQADEQFARIALEHPKHDDEAIGIANITTGSICASAGNRRVWGNYTHIINPETLASPMAISAVWVSAASAMVADGIATALFFIEAKELMKHFQFEYAMVGSDLSLQYSENFPAEFFSNRSEEKS
jgi:thiamine biosynthesis lipoprotein